MEITTRCKVESNIVIVLSKAFWYGQVPQSKPFMEIGFNLELALSELDVFEDQVFIFSIREVEDLHLASKWLVPHSIVQHVFGDGK